jgi:hypothetical protein
MGDPNTLNRYTEFDNYSRALVVILALAVFAGLLSWPVVASGDGCPVHLRHVRGTLLYENCVYYISRP